MQEKKPIEFCVGIDGYNRSIDAENELNSMFAGVFTLAAGIKILDYLRGITLNTVVPHSASNEVLRHQEGMRNLFRIIQERTNKGKEGTNATRSSNSPERPSRIRSRSRSKASAADDSAKP